MLSTSSEKYAYGIAAAEDERGFFLPGVVIDSVLDTIKPHAATLFAARLRQERSGEAIPSLTQHQLLIADPHIEFAKSKQLVLAALRHFGSGLGEQAETLLNAPERWQTTPTDPGRASGYCAAPYTRDNPEPYAVVTYNYDQTINDPIYIAHELGHLLACYHAKEIGSHPKSHMSEIQAFLLQFILYDNVIHHQENSSLQKAAQEHFNGEIIRSIYALPVALATLEAERSLTKDDNQEQAVTTYATILYGWLGEHWRGFHQAKLACEQIMDSDARDHTIVALHKHPSAAIIAAGLFAFAKQSNQRQQVLDATFGLASHQGLVQVLEKIGVTSQAELNRMIQGGFNILLENVSAHKKLDFLTQAHAAASR